MPQQRAQAIVLPFFWPLAGIALGALVASNSSFQPHIALRFGILAWFVDMTLVLGLSFHPVAVRVSVLVAGLFLAVPCFFAEPPFSRVLFMCLMVLPLAIAVSALFAPGSADWRGRWGFFFSWLGTREPVRRQRSFDVGALVRLIAATAIFGIAMGMVKAVPVAGYWLLVRWVAGAIMMLAAAELVTACHYFLAAMVGVSASPLMESPHLSASVSEFWTRRWNPAASLLVFRKFCFLPLCRRGIGFAMSVAFLVSGLGHLLLYQMATGDWTMGAAWGSFFLVQPLFILAERRLKVRRWSRVGARAWTVAVLGISSPLFIEPTLRLIGPSWGPPGVIVRPTLTVFGCLVVVNSFFLLVSLALCHNSGTTPPGTPEQAGQPKHATGNPANQEPGGLVSGRAGESA